ncbi:MAG: flagellar hook-basal body complex protein [Candidatus Auribacterota bacterium]|jgi:flagellar hook protein FlgE|nr:flagellar hook-basal body complex protein [Candidatus Auribacterota bacterium]
MAVRALYSGVSGLRNFQTQIDVIGNNIANSQTPGFKSSRVTFMSMLYQTMSAASAPTAEYGGTNPKQIGLGSMIGSIDQNFETGNLLSTGRKYDVAIQGGGFFVVSSGSQNFYTRCGAFNFDSNGNMVYDGGYKVQGLNATDGVLGSVVEDIQVPLGISLPAAATTSVSLVGNLNSSSQQVGTQLQSETFYSAEQAGNDTAVEGMLATGSANSIISGLVNGSSTVIVSTLNDTNTYTYSSTAVTNPAASLTFNSLDDLAAAIVANNSDISAATINSDGALRFTSATAGNTLTITSSVSSLQAALASANKTAGTFDAGATAITDEFSHRATASDALVNLRNSSGVDLGILNGDSISIGGSVGGTAITPNTLAVDGTTTLNDFTTAIQLAYGITTAGSVALNDGRLQINADGGTNYALSNIDITTAGTRPQFDSIFGNSAGNYATLQNASDNHSRSFTAYDSDGTAHTVTIKFNVREATGNQSRYVMDISSLITATGQPDVMVTPSSGSIVCNPDGSLASFDPPSITIQPSGVGNPMVIALNPGTFGTHLGLVMFEGDSTAGFRDSNGYASGDLQDVTIASDGSLYGNFTNGQVQILARLQLASFDNPEGLESVQNSMFRQTDNSGTANFDSAGVGQRGILVIRTLESSNVDLATEFVSLITAQRGFQTNSRVIKTADEVLRELVNLV